MAVAIRLTFERVIPMNATNDVVAFSDKARRDLKDAARALGWDLVEESFNRAGITSLE